MESKRRRIANILDKLVGLLFFGIPSLFHLVALVIPQISIPETSNEHLAFYFINIMFMTMFMFKVERKIIAFFLLPLTIQQFYVHGKHFLIFQDTQSIMVMGGLVVVWFYMLIRSTVIEYIVKE